MLFRARMSAQTGDLKVKMAGILNQAVTVRRGRIEIQTKPRRSRGGFAASGAQAAHFPPFRLHSGFHSMRVVQK